MNAKRSKVIVVGATGLIGSEVTEDLSAAGYEVIGVTHLSEPGLDLTRPPSIEALFGSIGAFDHVVVAAGDARFGALESLDEAAYEVGLRSKLMGQIHVARHALRRMPVGGSVTLTSGELSHAPIPGSAAVALVNGAIDAFVRAAALDAPHGRRINAVSPGWIEETLARLGRDPAEGVPARAVAELYRRAIESEVHGRVWTHADLNPGARRASA